MKIDVLIKDATPDVLTQLSAIGADPVKVAEPVKAAEPVKVADLDFEEVKKDEAGNDMPTLQECESIARKLDMSKHREGLVELLKSLGAKKISEVPEDMRAEFIEGVKGMLS